MMVHMACNNFSRKTVMPSELRERPGILRMFDAPGGFVASQDARARLMALGMTISQTKTPNRLYLGAMSSTENSTATLPNETLS